MNKKIFTLRLFLLLAALATAAISAAAARIDSLSYVSPLLPRPMAVKVVVPDNLSGPAPVVYMLNGYDGDCNQWLGNTPELPSYSDRYGMIFVLPSGMDAWYVDSPVQKNMKMKSFILDELIPAIDEHYPTDPDRRAITGLSMGGHGALTLAMDHPELFKAAGSTSGGVDLRPFAKRWNLEKVMGSPEANPEFWEGVSAASRVKGLKERAPELKIIFDCGIDDFFAPVNEQLHKAMLEEGVPHDYISRPGRHAHSYWRNAIKYHLVFFDSVFKAQGASK
ncbi:MAG: esterase family protein [Muribaculaceae bacterium]|nr:esterase family protein [Muribaculaceae bacterium]